MSCTTILVGKDASYDGSTMIARNDDSGAGHFTPKKLIILPARKEAYTYTSVLSHVKVDLPAGGMRCSITPNAVPGKGIWAACGVNEKEVGMTATETITSNPRVLGADPLVEYEPASGEEPEKAGGIGEEDLVMIVLPYISTAREGVLRLGSLLEQYGTYEMNGIAFSDKDGIWWLETIGGHHWIARRVPDDSYVVMPNQMGIDEFDFDDAFGEQEEYMCSGDLMEFIEKYHLDLTQYDKVEYDDDFDFGEDDGEYDPELEAEEDEADERFFRQLEAYDRARRDGFGENTAEELRDDDAGAGGELEWPFDDEHFDGADVPDIPEVPFDPRAAFGSHDDADHVYNTPRAWYMLRYFNPTEFSWDGPDAEFRPESDDLPWCLVPEKKITPEDVKYVLSSHFQGTPFDPYGSYGHKELAGKYRSIGINRTDFMGFVQIRPYMPEGCRAVEWISFASNAFNVMVPVYPLADSFPEYLSCTTEAVSTDSFYWTSRLIAALADADYRKNLNHIERYQLSVQSKASHLINLADEKMAGAPDEEARAALRLRANEAIVKMVQKESSKALGSVLYEVSSDMKNSFARSDA